MENGFKFYNTKKEEKNENNIENKKLSKNCSFNRRKRIEIPTKITIFNPFNLKFMPSDKITSLKEINKNYPINQNFKQSKSDRNNLKKKVKRPNVNNTLNDIYNAINNINKIDGKIKNILSHSSKKNNILNTKIESGQTSNNNLLEKNANINEPIIRSNSQKIKVPGKNKIIYRNHERNKRDYYTDYNNVFLEENKVRNTSLFRKPKYQTSFNKTSYERYFPYKNYFFLNDSEKEDENDSNLSDYNSITSNLSKEQDNNDDINHMNYTDYNSQFQKKEDYYSKKIMNMKFNLRSIRDKKIKNINKEQKELNYIIDQMQEKNKLIQNKTDNNKSKRNHNIKGFFRLEKKMPKSEILNDINNIDDDNKYNINLNRNNYFEQKINNYYKKYKSDNDEVNSEYINNINHNDKSLIRNNYYYNKYKLNKPNNMKQNEQKSPNKNLYNLNDYLKNKRCKNKGFNLSNIYLRNAKELIGEIHKYKNSRNNFRNKNLYYSFNTDLNEHNKENIIENIRNKKYKNYIKLKQKMPYNNYKINIEKKYNKLYNNNGSSFLSNCNFENKYIY